MNWNRYTEITKSRNAFWLGTLALIIRSRAQSHRLLNEVAAKNKCIMYGRLDEKTFLIDDLRFSVPITRRPYLNHEDCSRKVKKNHESFIRNGYVWSICAMQLLYSEKHIHWEWTKGCRWKWSEMKEQKKIRKKTRINLSHYPWHILNYIRFLLLYLYFMFLLKKIEAEI